MQSKKYQQAQPNPAYRRSVINWLVEVHDRVLPRDPETLHLALALFRAGAPAVPAGHWASILLPEAMAALFVAALEVRRTDTIQLLVIEYNKAVEGSMAASEADIRKHVPHMAKLLSQPPSGWTRVLGRRLAPPHKATCCLPYPDATGNLVKALQTAAYDMCSSEEALPTFRDWMGSWDPASVDPALRATQQAFGGLEWRLNPNIDEHLATSGRAFRTVYDNRTRFETFVTRMALLGNHALPCVHAMWLCFMYVLELAACSDEFSANFSPSEVTFSASLALDFMMAAYPRLMAQCTDYAALETCWRALIEMARSDQDFPAVHDKYKVVRGMFNTST